MIEKLVARLVTRANLPLLLAVYAIVIVVFGMLLPRMGDGASWVWETVPSPRFVAWCIAFPCMLVAFGIVGLLNQASTTIECGRAVSVPSFVRVINVVAVLGWIAAYLFRDAGAETRGIFVCAVVALFAWIPAWPTYVVRTYG